MIRKHSTIWHHFDDMGTQKAKCKHCAFSISVAGGSTGNLNRHLKTKHPTVPIKRSSASRSFSSGFIVSTPSTVCSDTSTPSQSGSVSSGLREIPTISSSATLRPHSSISPYIIKPFPLNKTKAINLQLLKMVCKEYQPFSIVENVEFRRFVSLLNPEYSLPSRKTLSNSLLPQQFHSLIKQIKVRLATAPAVSITTDGWTSCNNENFVTVTAHFIESDSLASSLLGCIEFNESHTAVNLASFLKNECSKWGIENKISAVVTDNTANIVAATKLNNWSHVPCMAHTINLAVKATLKPLELILVKVKALVHFFKQSSHAMAKLHEIQKHMGLPELKLKQDVPTRWNSTYDMLVRVHSNKGPLLSTLAILGNDNFKLSSDEWIVIKQSVSFLKVFYDVTNEISAEKVISLSKSFILSRSLYNFVQKSYKENKEVAHKTILEMYEIIVEQINNRFIKDTISILPQAALLDPRFKKKSFLYCPTKFETVYEELVDLVRRQIVSQTEITVEIKIEADENTVTPTMSALDKPSTLWEDFDVAPVPTMEPSIKDPRAMAIVEVDQFLGEPLINRHQDPLAWWEQRKYLYPNLHNIMLKRHCIPASSVPCEQIFSKAGQIMRERRSQLKPSKLTQILCLKENL